MTAGCGDGPVPRSFAEARPQPSLCRPRRIRPIAQRLREQAANALVELAVIFAFMGIPFILGTAEIASLVYYSMENANAAYAAARYGMRSSTFAEAISGITTAAQTEAPDIANTLTVTPSIFFTCSNAPNGTQYSGLSAQLLAAQTCTGGTNHPLEFVKVTTSTVVTPPFHCPGLPATFTLTSTSVMEVEQ